MLFPRTGKVDVVGFASPRRSYPEAAAFIACCCWGRRPAGLEEMAMEARWRAALTSSHHHVVNCSHECPTEALFRQRYSLPIPVWWHHELGKRPVMSELRRGWLQGQLASPLQWLFLRQRATCPLLAKFSFSTRELCSARLAALQHLSSAIDASPHSGGCLHLSEHIQAEKGCWDANASDQGRFWHTRPEFQRVAPHQMTTKRIWCGWWWGTRFSVSSARSARTLRAVYQHWSFQVTNSTFWVGAFGFLHPAGVHQLEKDQMIDTPSQQSLRTSMALSSLFPRRGLPTPEDEPAVPQFSYPPRCNPTVPTYDLRNR